VEDLETEVNPQELLMSSMTSEGAAERAQRELVVPWVRHAWDVFRNTLDSLRSTPKLESCYQWVAFKAFEFCVSFNRTTEFRKLCDTMRKHLTHWRNDFQKWDESEVDSRFTLANLERHMRTRFQQLKHCAELAMWSEGVRTVEDIFALIQLAPEEPSADLMAQYFEQLAVIFWKSDDLLFHAYATLQQYRVVISIPSVDPTAAQHLANRLLCAALCVPLFADATTEDERFFHVDFDRDKKDRLARLLNFNETPSRDTLLIMLGHMGLAKAVSPQLSALQQNLESKFHPLDLVDSVKPALEILSAEGSDMVQYVNPLEKLTLYRLLMQLTEVYSFLTMDFFEGLVKPLTLSGEELELEVARGCRAQLLKVRLDHCGRCIRLGAESMESGRMRSQLSALATALSDIVPQLPMDSIASSSAAMFDIKRTKVFDFARQSEDGTLAENLQRLKEIEQRREQQAREIEVKKRQVSFMCQLVCCACYVCLRRCPVPRKLMLTPRQASHYLAWRIFARDCNITLTPSVV
jgi:translation initiation factor 3 subunit A